jgi:hypothetical protein
MVKGAEPHCFGVRLENGWIWDPTYCIKARSKIAWRERTCGLCNGDKRAMSIIGEDSSSLKLDHSRLWRREVK